MHSTLPKHIAAYYGALRTFNEQGATTEGAVRVAFQNLLDAAGRPRGLTVLGEQTVKLANRRTIRLDGELRDEFRIRRGVWEAKDSADDLDEEIRSKVVAGYPTRNTLFEDTRRGVLLQNGVRVLDADLTDPAELQQLLDRFLDYSEPRIDEFHAAVAEFRREIPELAAGLAKIIEREKRENEAFRRALADFHELCRASLNPATTLDEVEDMLRQHLLTERIFRSVFSNDEFVLRNPIARELETVVTALTSRSFSRKQFLGKLDYFYHTIEATAATIEDYSEKQGFLHAVYEQFFQGYSTDTADTHGIVYTPEPIVRWMVASVDEVLKREFGTSLGAKGVHILDPCVGTGTFMLELMEHIGPSALPHKYAHELHCNEVLLLPYYVAAQNIEHEFFERTGTYRPFEGICFADTLDMGRSQLGIFTPENTERVTRQEAAPIQVIIGNPPYNVGQQNENDNNKNRKYKTVDDRIRETYAGASRATNRKALNDMYVRFFRWATDRLRGSDGVICLVSNNSFLDQYTFDGMRKELLKDFSSIYVFDLGGNVRQNPKLSGTTHNVFGIQVGVAVTLLIRRRNGQPQTEPAALYFTRVDEWWKRQQKYDYLDATADYTGIKWQRLTPDERGTWLTEGMAEEFETLLPMGSREAKAGAAGAKETIFQSYTLGIVTNRDTWAYDFDRETLSTRISRLVQTYNSEIDRWLRAKKPVDVDAFVVNDERRIKWSRDLKADLRRERSAKFSTDKLRLSLYRPFSRRHYFLDPVLSQDIFLQPRFFPNSSSESENRVICVTDAGAEKPFLALVANSLTDLHLVGAGAGTQTFPFYTYDEDGTNRRENITDWALAEYQARYGAEVTKWDVFHYVYGLLHSPGYRTRYAENLKRDLPHIPFVRAEHFAAFRDAGRELAAQHVGYEAAAEYPLRHIEKTPFTWRVERMRLSTDRTQLVVNPSLTLADIPPEAFDYRLGNRSALEWIVDQYRVKTDRRSGIVSDPNDPADPEAIVRLVKQVITVSVETVRLVGALPPLEPQP